MNKIQVTKLQERKGKERNEIHSETESALTHVEQLGNNRQQIL